MFVGLCEIVKASSASSSSADFMHQISRLHLFVYLAEIVTAIIVNHPTADIVPDLCIRILLVYSKEYTKRS